MTQDWTLQPLAGFPVRPGPVVLVVMDGVGIGAGDEADAVALARTPVLDDLKAKGLYLEAQAHGVAVGMPSDDDMGNSEVGHNAMGAGRVFAQGARLVSEAIASGQMFTTETWHWLTGPCIDTDKAVHLIGLLSDGNVHSHIDHLCAILKALDEAGVRKANVHALLDGRDVPGMSAHLYIEQLEAFMAPINAKGQRCYQIASGGGRMKVTMDRYQANWGMVKKGWEAHVHGKGRPFASAMEAVLTYRQELGEVIDQDLGEFVVVKDGQPVGTIQDGDAVILFNFRGDRAIELSQAFELETFTAFDRGVRPAVRFAGMMQYDGDLKLPARFLVIPPAIDRTFGEYLARNQVYQTALSETQKFGHVTYFWNGNRSGFFDPEQECYLEVLSDRVSFDERPWMKCAEITDLTLEKVREGKSRFIRLNFANGDMVGHTGKLLPTIIAVEAVDMCLGRIREAVEAVNGVLVVTADHGNADEMCMRDKKGRLERDKEGQLKAKTSHTLNPVPFIIYDPQYRGEYTLNEAVKAPGLGNYAATLLNFLGFVAPEDYLPSLIRLV